MRSLICLLVAAVLALLTGCGGANGAARDPVGGYANATTVSEAPPPPQAEHAGLFAPKMEMESDDGADEEPMADASSGSRQAPTPAPPPAPPAPPEAKPDALSTQRAQMAGQQTVPMLIYRATFTMAVFEAATSIDEVQKLATDLGGYLVKRDQQSIIIRVPAEKYKRALEGVTKLGDVLHREESVEDVTEQFHDLTTRLRNARAMRDRLEQLLERAKDVKEALSVEQELGRITAEIESMEGKLKLLRELISFSTITVAFQARPTDTVGSGVRLPFPWLDSMGLPSLLDLGSAQ